MLANYYLKADLQDIEGTLRVTSLCMAPYIEDQDQTVPGKCLGEIDWKEDFGRCSDCGCTYQIIKEIK